MRISHEILLIQYGGILVRYLHRPDNVIYTFNVLDKE